MSDNLTGAAFGGNLTLGKAGLAAGTTVTYTIANTVAYANKGLMYNLAAAANANPPATDYVTKEPFLPLAIGKSCAFVFGVDNTGTVQVVQSLPLQLQKGIYPATDAITGGLGAVSLPIIPDTITPFGYLLAESSDAAQAPWTLGTNNLSGVTGLTFTFHDLMSLPAQPVLS